MKGRVVVLDVLKGLAIVAVMLYHWGWLEEGWLGVEVFLVVGGYLMTRQLCRAIEGGRLSYWGTLGRRLARLWPLMLIVSLVTLVVGYCVMLPWHLLQHSAAVGGSSTFTNNVVQELTSANYWDTLNIYKPLMHTWFIAVLMQLYIIYPLFFVIPACKAGAQWRAWAVKGVTVAAALSLALYLSPLLTSSMNFYLLPSRFYEFAVGGLIALVPIATTSDWRKRAAVIAAVVLALALLVTSLDDVKLRTLGMTAMTAVVVAIVDRRPAMASGIKWLRPVAFLGAASYSLYLWHQPIIAFFRLLASPALQASAAVKWGLLAAAVVLGLLSFVLVERPLGKLASRSTLWRRIILGVCAVVAVAVVIYTYRLCERKGVVRDVPSFDITLAHPLDNQPMDVNDYSFTLIDRFVANGKKNVLVVGDSYARDWVNVLRASGVDTVVNLRYHNSDDGYTASCISQADVIFLASRWSWQSVYGNTTPALEGRNFYRVGMKEYDFYPENIYCFHLDEDPSQVTCQPTAACKEVNAIERALYGDRYIDMIAAIANAQGEVPVLTPEGKFISPDRVHLTSAGAQYYAQHIDVWQYIK